MTAIALTYAQVAALKPCSDRLSRAVEFLGGEWTTPVDAAMARQAGVSFQDIFYVTTCLAQREPDVARRLRLWAADCAARVLHIYESRHPADHRPRTAIIGARQYARGEITDAVNAADAAYAAAADADACAYAATNAANAAANAAAAAYAAAAAAAAADADAYVYASYAAYAATTAAAERDWQFMRLCEWLSESEPQDWPLTEQQEPAR